MKCSNAKWVSLEAGKDKETEPPQTLQKEYGTAHPQYLVSGVGLLSYKTVR